MDLKGWIEKLAHRAAVKALAKLERDDNFQFLKQSSLFQDLGPEAYHFLYSHLIERRYKRHEIVFKEGNPGICLFIIKKGRVEIYSEDEDSGQKTLYTVLGDGAIFGELSLMSMPYRASSARTLDHGTVLLTLSSYDLDSLCDQFPRAGIKIVKSLNSTMCTHLSEVDKQLQEARREIERLRAELHKDE